MAAHMDIEKKKIRVLEYPYTLMNVEILLHECVVYVDCEINEQDFDPWQTQHFLPKFEQARALVIIAAKQRQLIRLLPEDKHNGVVAIYKRACKRELAFGKDETIKNFIRSTLTHLESI